MRIGEKKKKTTRRVERREGRVKKRGTRKCKKIERVWEGRQGKGKVGWRSKKG